MNDQVRAFLDRLDNELIPVAREGDKFDMYLIGRAALVLFYDFPLATRDIDVVSLQNSELERRAKEVLGKGSPLANQLGLYLDLVPQGVPSLPSWFRRHSELLQSYWKVLRIWKLEVHDLAASKLKSFRPQDREDLQRLCDQGLLDAMRLQKSLEAAFQFKSPKREDTEEDPDTPDWGKTLANLRRVMDYLNGKTESI